MVEVVDVFGTGHFGQKSGGTSRPTDQAVPLWRTHVHFFFSHPREKEKKEEFICIYLDLNSYSMQANLWKFQSLYMQKSESFPINISRSIMFADGFPLQWRKLSGKWKVMQIVQVDLDKLTQRKSSSPMKPVPRHTPKQVKEYIPLALTWRGRSPHVADT